MIVGIVLAIMFGMLVGLSVLALNIAEKLDRIEARVQFLPYRDL